MTAWRFEITKAKKEKENFCHIGNYNLWCRKYLEELGAVSKD